MKWGKIEKVELSKLNHIISNFRRKMEPLKAQLEAEVKRLKEEAEKK